MDIRAGIDKLPMVPFQIGTVATCLIINLLDGFDVLAISFAMPQISEEWSLQADEIGWLFSSGLAGMVLASIVLSGIADYIGRRWTILVCLAVISVGMLASGFAQSTWTLGAWRFVVGLGVGTILPALNTLVAEFSSAKRRELAITTMQSGYPAGAILGGLVAVALVGEFGWRGIFFAGGIASIGVLIVAARFLPESLDYLLVRRPPNALARVNEILVKLGHAELDALPDRPADVKDSAGYGALFTAQTLPAVCFLSGAFFFVMACFYFVASWTPKLLVDAGLSLTEGISGGIVLSLGGILGGLSLGWLASKIKAARLTVLYILVTPLMMWLFTLTDGLTAMLIAAFVMGFFLFGSMMGLYAIAPSAFPVSARASATGVAVGMGRFGAIVGPLATGYLLAAQWQTDSLYLLFGVPMLLSSVMVLMLGRRL